MLKELIENVNKVESLKFSLNESLEKSLALHGEEILLEKDIIKICEAMEQYLNHVEYYTKPVELAILKENSTGRFEALDDNGECIKTYTSGTPIEIYDKTNGWYVGRVEHDNRGYYFYDSDLMDDLENPMLYDGMKVRVRL